MVPAVFGTDQAIELTTFCVLEEPSEERCSGSISTHELRKVNTVSLRLIEDGVVHPFFFFFFGPLLLFVDSTAGGSFGVSDKTFGQNLKLKAIEMRSSGSSLG